MFVSIAIDFTRSRMLKRAALKYKSQALEADALNYSADLISSSVVIVGLGLVWLSHLSASLSFLVHADAIAAIAVAVLILTISAQLGRRAIDALLDQSPEPGIEDAIIRAVETMPGVIDCHHVRIRSSGPRLFVDVHVIMHGDMPLREVHDLMTRIERRIQRMLPDADVTVHPEPESELPTIE